VVNSNLGPILHRLAPVHPWKVADKRTDERTDGRNHDNSSTVTKVRSAKNELRRADKAQSFVRNFPEGMFLPSISKIGLLLSADQYKLPETKSDD